MGKWKKPLICLGIFLLVWAFTSIFYIQMVPDIGMLPEAIPVFWMLVFIAGELAVCTYLVVSAIKEHQNKDKQAQG